MVQFLAFYKQKYVHYLLVKLRQQIEKFFHPGGY